MTHKRKRGTAIVETSKGILVTSGHKWVFILPGVKQIKANLFASKPLFIAFTSCDGIIPAIETSFEYSSRDIQSNIREVKWTFRT